MPKGNKHLDLEVDVLPDEGEVVVSVGDVPILQADVDETETTINLLGVEVASITGNLTGLLGPLDLLEQQLESLKHSDLKNLDFNFDAEGGTAELQLVIDKPGNQEDVTVLEATITASDVESTIDIGGEGNEGVEVTLTGVNLSSLFPALETLDLLV